MSVGADEFALFLHRILTHYGKQVVDVDHVRQRAAVKLIPRVDLHVVAAKLVSE